MNQLDGTTSIDFSTAYIHESIGLPGFDSGLTWTQVATITIENANPVSLDVVGPFWVLGGTLRIGPTLYEGFIPAEGQFEESTEFVIQLSTEEGDDGGSLNLKGDGVKIELRGERLRVEEFNGPPRREPE
jgi:hypothetical protein